MKDYLPTTTIYGKRDDKKISKCPSHPHPISRSNASNQLKADVAGPAIWNVLSLEAFPHPYLLAKKQLQLNRVLPTCAFDAKKTW